MDQGKGKRGEGRVWAFGKEFLGLGNGISRSGNKIYFNNRGGMDYEILLVEVVF